MTINLSNRTRGFSFLVLSAILVIAVYFIVHSSKFSSHPELLSFAVTLDLTMVIPLLYYFIISKKLKIAPVTVLIVFLVCTGIATLILPKQNQFYLDKIKYLFIFTELAIVIYGIIKIKEIIKSFNNFSQDQNDFVYNLTMAMQQALGQSKIWAVVVGEINTIRYGLLFWLCKKEINEGQKYFSTHKNSGYSAIWTIIFFVMLIETTGLHLLLRNWSPVLAVIITILSIYTIIFFISDLAAIIKRPIVFNDNKLFFRIGIRWNAIIDTSIINSVEIIRNFDKDRNKGILNCALAGDPNIKISLNEKIIFKSFYGIKKTADRFVFNIDDEKEFIRTMKHYVKSNQLFISPE